MAGRPLLPPGKLPHCFCCWAVHAGSRTGMRHHTVLCWTVNRWLCYDLLTHPKRLPPSAPSAQLLAEPASRVNACGPGGAGWTDTDMADLLHIPREQWYKSSQW